MKTATVPEQTTQAHREKTPSPRKPHSAVPSFFNNLFRSQQAVIGIDIGSSCLKLLQLQKSGSSYVIRNCLTKFFPLEVRQNPEEKKKLVQDTIRQFLRQARVRNASARFSVYGKGVNVFSLVVPNLSKKDLRAAVAIELKKRLPYQADLSNVSFDYFLTSDLAKDDKSSTVQVTCIAAEKALMEEHIRLLKELDIQPLSLNAIPDCLGNLVPFCFNPVPQKTVVIIDIGAVTSLLNFYRGTTLVFSREIPLGGDAFTEAMTKPLSTPLGEVVISAADAEKLKANCGIPMEDESKTDFLTDFGSFRGEQIVALMRPVLERLAMEITRTFSYYCKTFRAPAIDELNLTGGCSRLRNLDKFLLMNIVGLQKVQSLNLLKSIKSWADSSILSQDLVMEQAAPHLAVAFGLCLQKGGTVNLLPMKEKVEQKALLFATLPRIIFPLLFILSAVFYGSNYASSLRLKILCSQVQKEINSVSGQADKVLSYMEKKNALDQRKELLEKARGRQPSWEGALKELSLVTPAEIVLRQVSLVHGDGTKRLSLAGTVFPQITIADMVLSQYQIALEESPFFSLVKVVSSKSNMYSPVPQSDFEISCQLDY